MAHGFFNKKNLDLANYNVSLSLCNKNNFFKARQPHGEIWEPLGENRQATLSHKSSLLKFEASETQVVLKVCQLLSEDDNFLVDYGNAQLWCEHGAQLDSDNPAVINLRKKLGKMNIETPPSTLAELNASASDRARKDSLSQCQYRGIFNYESSEQKKITTDPRRQPSQFDQLAKLSDDLKNALEKIDLLTRDISSFAESYHHCKTSYALSPVKNKSAVMDNLKTQGGSLPVTALPSVIENTYYGCTQVETLDTQNVFMKTPPIPCISSLWPANSQIFRLESSSFYDDLHNNTDIQSLCEPYAFMGTQNSTIGVVNRKSKRSYQSRRSSYRNFKIEDGCSEPTELSKKTALQHLTLNVIPSYTDTDSETNVATSKRADCLPEPNVKGSVDSVKLKESNGRNKIKLRPSVLSEVASLLESKLKDCVDGKQLVEQNTKQEIKLKPSKLSSVIENPPLPSMSNFSLLDSEGESKQKEKPMINNFEDELIKSLELFSFNSKFEDNIVEMDSGRIKLDPSNLENIDDRNKAECDLDVKLLLETMTTMTSNQESIKNNSLESTVTADSSMNPQNSKESLSLSCTCSSTLVGEVCDNDLKLVNKISDNSCKQGSPIAYSSEPKIDQRFPETDPNNSEVPMCLTQCPRISQTSHEQITILNPPVETINTAEDNLNPTYVPPLLTLEVSLSNEELGKSPTQNNKSKSTQNLNLISMSVHEKNSTNAVFDSSQSDANCILIKTSDGELFKSFSPTKVWDLNVIHLNLISQENMSTENSKTVSGSSLLLSSPNVHIEQDCLSIPKKTNEIHNVDCGDIDDVSSSNSTKIQDITSLNISTKTDNKRNLDDDHVGRCTNLVQDLAGFHRAPTNNVHITVEPISEIADPLATLTNNNYIIGSINPMDCPLAMQDSESASNIESVTSSSNKAVEKYVMNESCATYAKMISGKCDVENGGKDSLSINSSMVITSFNQDEGIFMHSPYSAECEHKQCTFKNTNIDIDIHLNAFIETNQKTGDNIGATRYTTGCHQVEKLNHFEEAYSDTNLEIELTSEAIGNDYIPKKSVDEVKEISKLKETYLHSETDQMIQDEMSINETYPLKNNDENVTQADYLTNMHYYDIDLNSEEFNDFDKNSSCKMSSTMKESPTSPHILNGNSLFDSDLCFSLPPQENNLDSEWNCSDAKSDENNDVCQTCFEVANSASSTALSNETSPEQNIIHPGYQGTWQTYLMANSPLQTSPDCVPISAFIHSNSTNCGSVKLSETKPEVTSHSLPRIEVDSYELPGSSIQDAASEKEVHNFSCMKRSVSYSPGGLFSITFNTESTRASTCFEPKDHFPKNRESYGFNSTYDETQSDSSQSQLWEREPELGAGARDIEPIDESNQLAATDSAVLVAADIGAYDVPYVLEDSSYFPGSKRRPPSPFLVRTRLNMLKSELALEFGKHLPEACIETVKRIDVGDWQLEFMRRKEAYRQKYGFVDEKTMYFVTGSEASNDIDEIKLLPESFNREIVFWHSLSVADSNFKDPQRRVRMMLACKVLLAFVYEVGAASGEGQLMKGLVKTQYSEFLPIYAVFYTSP